MTSVVIVGSGFTGFECARGLARRLRRRHADVDVTIISPVDYLLYAPLLADVAGGVIDGRFVTIPLAGTLTGVRAVLAYLNDTLFSRSIVSMGLASEAASQFSASEGIPMPKTRTHIA